MKDKYVFLDVESDGLYGNFLTAALIVVDNEGNEISRAYYGICKEHMHVTDPWVIEHVLPIIGDYEECENEKQLLQKTWDFWLQYQETAYMICDVAYPVECRFLRACVALNQSEYMCKAPFPLIDLSSLLMAKGYDPLYERKHFASKYKEECVHNALYDVEVAIEVWKKISKN